jgi:cystathionine beta-lyase
MRWAVMHVGSRSLRSALDALPGHYLGAPNQMGVVASVAAWTKGRAWLEAVHAVLDENRALLTSLLVHYFPAARYRPPDATYLAWIDLRSCGFGDDPAATFDERGVMLSPGLLFGPQGAGHVRLNLATSPTILERMMSAMAAG